MGRLFLFSFILSSLTLLNSCCTKCEKELKVCENDLANCRNDKCKDIPPTEEATTFYLTLSIDKNRTHQHQTIFVESPRDSSGNSFALAAQFDFKEFDNNTYRGVKINKLTIRRLSGDSFKITDVRTEMGNGYTTNREAGIIKVMLEKIETPGKFRDEFEYKGKINEIESLSIDATIQTDISYLNGPLWRPRICESFIGK
ncbi:hypothetical protein ACFSQJ_13070 [Croceitalea marina]|uniref:Lipoprotein n=1 Tax=Croceitalea marina TaxID=1775166 RepID=A0ABW5MYI4_9FLAO